MPPEDPHPEAEPTRAYDGEPSGDFADDPPQRAVWRVGEPAWLNDAMRPEIVDHLALRWHVIAHVGGEAKGR